MRPRTFILLILVLVLFAAAVLLIIAQTSGGGPLADLLGGGDDQPNGIVDNGDGPAQDGDDISAPVPLPTPTRAINLVAVVVAQADLPVGTQLRPDLLEVEFRPDSNIALQGNYAFENIEDLSGEFVKVPISKGQAVLRPMLALNTTDLGQFGSDLALYVSNGRVAVAFPINTYSGAAYAMRPGDLVDVLMSLTAVRADEEFNTPLPNDKVVVDVQALSEGDDFIQSERATLGRLELIPELDLVAEIIPGSNTLPGFEENEQIPRRVTQLTIQQAEVLWVGTWQDPRDIPPPEEEEQASEGAEGETAAAVPTPTPVPQRFDNPPDVVILSMPAQEALALKWALEVGLNSTLALRAQGDSTTFSTTSVSLPQIVEQGGLIRPEPGEFLLAPPWEEVPVPFLPAEAPGQDQ